MLRNALTLITGAVILVFGFMFSLVVLAIVVVIGLVIWGYLWWKTRKLREAIREQAVQNTFSDGHIIEGESVVVEEVQSNTTSLLPCKHSRKDL